MCQSRLQRGADKLQLSQQELLIESKPWFSERAVGAGGPLHPTSSCHNTNATHKAIPCEDKLFGRASAPRCTVVTTPANSGCKEAASCSPLIGPGTYDIQPGMASSQTGHAIPVGPRGSDLRSFRSNRVLKHSYETNEDDSVIGSSALYH
jgi:hypothetical protein